MLHPPHSVPFCSKTGAPQSTIGSDSPIDKPFKHRLSVLQFLPFIAQDKGPHSIRNIKNNLSRLFRAAKYKGLFSPPPAELTTRYRTQDRPTRPGAEALGKDGSHLRYHQWPPQLQADFASFRKWATAPMVPGRKASWRKRQVTVDYYRNAFQAYFGFIKRIHKIQEPTFDHLFDLQLVQDFVYWYVNINLKRSSYTIHDFLTKIIALISQYRPQPSLYEKLLDLRRSVPQPTTVYDKDDAWVPLRQLRQIGESLWPPKLPNQLHSKGTGFADRACLSLMLQLWTYIPYRQSNIREMSFDKHFYKRDGILHIRFTDEQLKIAVKRGQPNIFDLPFPEPLISQLNSYLTIWRPILIRDATPPPSELFLKITGKPYDKEILREKTNRIVYNYTGKYWHPRIIRTVWATEYIRSTGDFFTAAIMLNDTLETVIKTYAHLRDENVAENAYKWALGQRTRICLYSRGYKPAILYSGRAKIGGDAELSIATLPVEPQCAPLISRTVSRHVIPQLG